MIHLALIDICSILEKSGLKLATSPEKYVMSDGFRTFKLNLVTEIKSDCVYLPIHDDAMNSISSVVELSKQAHSGMHAAFNNRHEVFFPVFHSSSRSILVRSTDNKGHKMSTEFKILSK